jgi:hypothetical protein
MSQILNDQWRTKLNTIKSVNELLIILDEIEELDNQREFRWRLLRLRQRFSNPNELLASIRAAQMTSILYLCGPKPAYKKVPIEFSEDYARTVYWHNGGTEQ